MLTITVHSTPAPQGSKKFLGIRGGHAILAESSKKVKPWREAVKWAALEAMTAQKRVRIIGPVTIQIDFYLLKPASAPKRRETFPDKKPDVDKLVRSTFDALKDAGVYEDDSRVISLTARKLFAGSEWPGALQSAGAIIRVQAYS